MNILVINGHKFYPYAKGELNTTLFNKIVEVLSIDNVVSKTVVEDGYDVEDEQNKILGSDIIIFQTPINWFSVPWLLKQYFDDVYKHGAFFGPSEE